MGEQTPNIYPEMLSHYPIKLNLQNMLLYPEGRGCKFLWNIATCLPNAGN